MQDVLISFQASTRDFIDSMSRATTALSALVKQFRKHPRSGYMPRRRLRKNPPPWRRARLQK